LDPSVLRTEHLAGQLLSFGGMGLTTLLDTLCMLFGEETN
jgi:hypothetical protein